MKQLTDISWNVTEAVYRKDKSISYSMLSTYERDGFDAIFKHKQTSSLTFGSIVDTIMTDGWEDDMTVFLLITVSPKFFNQLDDRTCFEIVYYFSVIHNLPLIRSVYSYIQ